MPFIVMVGLGLWFWLGDPANAVANWFWTNDAAPWEEVDAFYYPNRSDLTDFRERLGLSSVNDCRVSVGMMASEFNDANLTRGDYECGIGRSGSYGSLRVYRLTAE